MIDPHTHEIPAQRPVMRPRFARSEEVTANQSRLTTSIGVISSRQRPPKRAVRTLVVVFMENLWRSRPSQPLQARTRHMSASSHPLAGLSSTLMTHGEPTASMFVFARSLADRGRRARSEYGAHLEISNSLIVSDVLLGSTVDQVSALSPALNLVPSMHMVLTMARRRRRSANAAFLFGLCAIFGGRGCVGWVVIGHESDTG